ncbi:MAG: SigE family RNA polymerase sigma factor [Micrococcales bacterium]|nr:SigE family RNA polymerase sigma factor [Micrococcales bacterium]
MSLSLSVTGQPAVAHAHTSHDTEFSAFMAANLPRLMRTAWLLAGDQDRADDLVQHALARTYGAWARVGHQDPLAYTRKIMANRRIDLWRARRREVLVPPESVPGGVEDDWAGRLAERDRLVSALATLRPRVRRVVVLRYVDGLSIREVASTLGIPAGTVQSDASRGLAQLRETLNKESEQ